MSKKDDIWMSYEDYIFEQYFYGRVSKEEYELAKEYVKDKTKGDKSFKEWVEGKQKL